MTTVVPDTERQPTTRVSVHDGTLEGLALGPVDAFLGIPYATPPVGDLRFLSPRPLTPWDGVRPATSLGHPSPQSNSDYPAWQDPNRPSEDCLVLNVWAPTRREAALPVMVWLHGGACVYGSAGAPVYDGARLAELGDVVVVSINHRLNAFGYTWFGDLVPDLCEHANPGQLDIEMALGWVRQNIAAFGGDASNTTVFGESGGGGKIGALCASPSAAGLFDKMIIQSGPKLMVHQRAEATEVAQALVNALGLDDVSMETLQAIESERITAAADAVMEQFGIFAFEPVLDGTHMSAQPWQGEALGAGVPLLIGTTTHESISLSPGMADLQSVDTEFRTEIKRFFLSPTLSDEQWNQVIEAYRNLDAEASVPELAVAVTTDLSLWASTIEIIQRRAATTAPTFAFEFAWRTPCFGSVWSPHGGELPFVFGNLEYPTAWDGNDTADLRAQYDPEGARYRLCGEVIAAWASFARSGDPSTVQVPWPAWTETTQSTMVMDREGSRVEAGHATARWAVVRALPRGC
jgi:para-nitrobenzyl esterase